MNIISVSSYKRLQAHYSNNEGQMHQVRTRKHNKSCTPFHPFLKILSIRKKLYQRLFSFSLFSIICSINDAQSVLLTVWSDYIMYRFVCLFELHNLFEYLKNISLQRTTFTRRRRTLDKIFFCVMQLYHLKISSLLCLTVPNQIHHHASSVERYFCRFFFLFFCLFYFIFHENYFNVVHNVVLKCTTTA